MQNLYEQLYNRTSLVATSEKYEYTVYMLDLLKDCYKCFFLSLIEKHWNEPIIYYNFSFVIEKSFWNLISLLHSLTYHFLLLFSSTFSVVLNLLFFQMTCLQVSAKQIFSVNQLFYVILQSFFCIQHFSGPRFFWVQVFQGPSPGSGIKI